MAKVRAFQRSLCYHYLQDYVELVHHKIDTDVYLSNLFIVLHC